MSGENALAKTDPRGGGLPVLLAEERTNIITVPDRGTMAIVVKTLNIPADGFDLIIKPKAASGNFPARPGSRQPKPETYSLLAQIKGISFRNIGPLQIERNARGKIQSVMATMACDHIGPTGEQIHDEETMFLDMDDFINEERKKRCFVYVKKSGSKELLDDRVKIIRDEFGNVEDVIYILPDAEEAEVHAECERRRTMLPRILLTKIHNRLTRRATGIGSRPVMPGSENEPERVVITAAVVTSEARTGSELGVYREKHQSDFLPAAESSLPHDAEEPADMPVTVGSSFQGKEADSNEPPTCDTCGKELSKKDLEYCPRKNTGRNDCYPCWHKSKEE